MSSSAPARPAAVSQQLTGAGVEHAALERGRVGQTWRGRWDSFCLVTPNWSVRVYCDDCASLDGWDCDCEPCAEGREISA